MASTSSVSKSASSSCSNTYSTSEAEAELQRQRTASRAYPHSSSRRHFTVKGDLSDETMPHLSRPVASGRRRRRGGSRVRPRSPSPAGSKRKPSRRNQDALGKHSNARPIDARRREQPKSLLAASTLENVDDDLEYSYSYGYSAEGAPAETTSKTASYSKSYTQSSGLFASFFGRRSGSSRGSGTNSYTDGGGRDSNGVSSGYDESSCQGSASSNVDGASSGESSRSQRSDRSREGQIVDPSVGYTQFRRARDRKRRSVRPTYFPRGAVDVGPYARSVLVTSVACLVVGLGIVVAAFVAFPVSWDALSVAHVGLLGMVLVGLVSCVVGLIGMTSIRDDQGAAARQHLALSYCGCLVALFLLAVALAVVFLLSATDFVSQGLAFSEHLGSASTAATAVAYGAVGLFIVIPTICCLPSMVIAWIRFRVLASRRSGRVYRV